jgi:hypothetical protein
MVRQGADETAVEKCAMENDEKPNTKSIKPALMKVVGHKGYLQPQQKLSNATEDSQCRGTLVISAIGGFNDSIRFTTIAAEIGLIRFWILVRVARRQ